MVALVITVIILLILVGISIVSLIYKIGTYESEGVSAGSSLVSRLQTINTIEINIKEKYNNYKNLTKDSFFAMDVFNKSSNDTSNKYIEYGSVATKIVEYNSDTGILKITKPFGWRDDVSNTLDACYLGSTTIYLVENSIEEL